MRPEPPLIDVIQTLYRQIVGVREFVNAADSLDWKLEDRTGYEGFLKLCAQFVGWDKCRLLHSPDAWTVSLADWKQLRSNWAKLRRDAERFGGQRRISAENDQQTWESEYLPFEVAYVSTQWRLPNDTLLVAYRRETGNAAEGYDERSSTIENLRLAAMCFRGRKTLPTALRYFSGDFLRCFERYEELERETEWLRTEPKNRRRFELLDQLQPAQPGRPFFSDFEDLVRQVFEVLFESQLIFKGKQEPIHGGSKVVDLLFLNRADQGFFNQLSAKHFVPCAYIFVECKNYGDDIANPELDQLLGRFAQIRGKFGFLICNRIADRMSLLHRCREAARDGQGWILALDVDDLSALLRASLLANKPSEVWDLLDHRFRILVF